MQKNYWSNPSVREFARGKDPVDAITSAARGTIFKALEGGWKGPPFDPFALAQMLGIKTEPRADVMDARTVPVGATRYRIEFNPDRPTRRMRYSVFHEIAHTLFPDCGAMIRNRGEHSAARSDDWQLETLCNIAAAEFLLPTGALGDPSALRPSIDTVLELRRKFEASAEAALLRVGRLTSEPALAFACHREPQSGRYAVEYAAATPGSKWSLRTGWRLPPRTAAAGCTAIGYTAKGRERWADLGDVFVECVGVAPFPRETYPRVIGFVTPLAPGATAGTPITYVRGDATLPRGGGAKIVVQVVSDGAASWGGSGFSLAVGRRWPAAQKAFTAAVSAHRAVLTLGNAVAADVGSQTTLLSLVAQHGYGPSPRPRIRYGALRDALIRAASLAREAGATVHMPRIGAGQAGGAWPIIEEIIREALTAWGIAVTVYDPPQGSERPKPQGDLPLGQ